MTLEASPARAVSSHQFNTRVSAEFWPLAAMRLSFWPGQSNVLLLGKAQGEQTTNRTFAGAVIYSRDAAGTAAKSGTTASNTGSQYAPTGSHEQHNRTGGGQSAHAGAAAAAA
jgi:hypothetical protein